MIITKRDIRNIIIIGALVGLLVQPVIINIGAEKIGSILPAPILALPFLVLQVAAFMAFAILAPVALYIASIVARFVPVVYQIAKFGAVGSLNSLVANLDQTDADADGKGDVCDLPEMPVVEGTSPQSPSNVNSLIVTGTGEAPKDNR